MSETKKGDGETSKSPAQPGLQIMVRSLDLILEQRAITEEFSTRG